MAVDISCPSQEVESRSAVNADFWHETRELLRGRYGDIVVLGWCGASGDQSPHLMFNRAAEAREALRWLKQLGDPYEFSAFDADGRVGIDWGVYGAPETFLIGADGIVLHKHLGPLTAAIWQEDFVPLIEAGGPAS